MSGALPFLAWALAFALVALGLVGAVLPLLPGAALVFAGILVAAAIDGFARIGPLSLLVVAGVGAGSLVADYAATALGARRFGGSRWGMAGAVLGLLVGVFLGLPGMLLGPVVGAVAFELGFARQSLEKALHAGLGTFLGFLLASVVKGALATMMVAVAVFAYLV